MRYASLASMFALPSILVLRARFTDHGNEHVRESTRPESVRSPDPQTAGE